MTRYVARTAGFGVAVLLALIAIVFALQHVSGLNPARALLGANASSEAVAAKEHELGYDRPITVQFLNYVGDALQGDLGISVTTRGPVTADIARYLPATLELAIAAVALALVLGLVLGAAAVLGGARFGWIRYLLISGSSAPPFLLAIGLILVFGVWTGMLPTSGRVTDANLATGPTGLLLVDTVLGLDAAGFLDALRHLVLPAVCVALAPAVAIGRVLRNSPEDTFNSEYAQTARAIGLSDLQILRRHALRNSLNDVLAVAAFQIGAMFAGVVVVETVFSWPGLGLYASQSIPNADFPAIAGITLVIGTAYVAINAISDVLQSVIDPRIRSAIR
ncbi:ABC transporter permease [Mycobacterium sp. NAZ190054]|uniref:ABC transporter permease n=1 Tax=Mycobacterium sp. NAZ190054 TaxID=1747766 RepID=UPI000795EEFE|nr:ABC transporter permease [Mycobacterium sp. NAZ190054]KWX66125.1 hypothetical protein ASJ79_06630 [Mycobacterium sp. NAZ190054]